MSDKRNRNRTVFRIDRPNKFTTIANDTLRTPNISWKAKGLLAAMLSYPHDWDFNVAHLLTITTDGRDSTYAGIKELIDAGYIERRDIREGGRIVRREMIVRELPAPGKSGGGPTTSGFAVSGKSDTTNTYPKNTKEKPSSTSVDAHAEKKEASASTTPSPREVPASASPKEDPAAFRVELPADKPITGSRADGTNPRALGISPRELERQRRAAKRQAAAAADGKQELQELAEVWNQHRGRLREFRSLAGRRVTNLKRLVRQCAEAGADPKLVVRLAAQELSKDEHYLAGKYDLENAIQSGRIAKFIDDALAPQPGEGLVAGQVYSWPRDPSRPWAGNLMGAFTGELVEVRGRTFAVMEIDGATYRAPVDSLEPKE